MKTSPAPRHSSFNGLETELPKTEGADIQQGPEHQYHWII